MDHTTQSLQIYLTPDQKDLLITLVDNGHKLTCDLIGKYWNEHWDKCPLCGAKVKEDGIIVHEQQQ